MLKDCRELSRELKPKVVIGDAYRRFKEDGQEELGKTITVAGGIVKAFVDYTARLLLLKCSANL